MADLQAEIDAAAAAVSKQGETVRSLKAAVKTGSADKASAPSRTRWPCRLDKSRRPSSSFVQLVCGIKPRS